MFPNNQKGKTCGTVYMGLRRKFVKNKKSDLNIYWDETKDFKFRKTKL